MDSVQIISAYLHNRQNCQTATVYQYNMGMILRIIGPELPQAYEVDFANSVTGQSITQIGGADGVTIPDQFFVPGSMIHAWVVLVGEDYVVTRYHIMIPISPRAVRTSEEPTPSQQSAVDQAIAALNQAVEDAETAITHYPTVIDGYWHVWDVTAGEYVSTGVAAQGPKGGDGSSPEITVTTITGGHRITITDADGTKTVDVMDGTDGDDGRGIVSIEKTGTAGLVDTYTITYTRGDPTTFTVTNGADGAPGVGVPAGGTTGQVLRKASGTDYDTEWATPDPGGVTDYTALTNKPQINGVTLSGNKSLSDIGAASTADIPVAVEAWLEENVTNPDSPPLDRSLSLNTAAAPADMVGELKDDVNSLKTEIDGGQEWVVEQTASRNNDNYYKFGTALIKNKEYRITMVPNESFSHDMQFGTAAAPASMVDSISTINFSANVPVTFQYTPTADGIAYVRFTNSTSKATMTVSALQRTDGLASEVGQLSDLDTDEKTSLVSAINEVNKKSAMIGDGDDIVFAFEPQNNFSDLTVVGDKLLCFKASDISSGIGSLMYYAIDLNAKTATLEKIRYHHWGHCNSVDYNSTTDCLLVSYEYNYGETYISDKFYVIQNASTVLDGTGDLPELADCAIEYDFSDQEWGAYPNCCWGYNNYGAYDQVIVFADNCRNIVVIQLGKGTNDLGLGEYSASSSNDFNGSYKVLKTYTLANPNGRVNQGADYYNGILYLGMGHVGSLIWKVSLNHDGTATIIDELYSQFAGSDGTIYSSGSTEGVAVTRDYIIENLSSTLGNRVEIRKK